MMFVVVTVVAGFAALLAQPPFCNVPSEPITYNADGTIDNLRTKYHSVPNEGFFIVLGFDMFGAAMLSCWFLWREIRRGDH